ncbi:transposase [Streptomyces maoxianensis]|uniref:Transposase n=1 Tax=Streptomyces maoxianensis TaxID=1459942 RepID=A0ABV9GHA4_9ACTN
MDVKKKSTGTRKSTLHRLTVPDGGEIELRTLVRPHYLDRPGYQVREFAREGVTGLLVNGGTPETVPTGARPSNGSPAWRSTSAITPLPGSYSAAARRAGWPAPPARYTALCRAAPARLPGPGKSIWYHTYVITDIFSRYVVGHTVERAESAGRAEELIRETIERNGIVPETEHTNRGTSMTSRKASQLLIDLGVTRSHSRPRVSNDNPYSESQFRTTKYAADYPERFDSPAHARECMEGFIAYYNHDHRHSGICLHTPASVHFGTAEQVRDQRAVALAEAYDPHPQRFARRPRPPRIPGRVWINDPAKRREPEPQGS